MAYDKKRIPHKKEYKHSCTYHQKYGNNWTHNYPNICAGIFFLSWRAYGIYEEVERLESLHSTA